jgi:hypothetical protein
MKQYEEVIKVMESESGLATLATLYQKVNVKNWKTKTPFATIRRIVQDERFFFKIKPGLWALNSYRNKISEFIPIGKLDSQEEKDKFSHSYYQGLLVELGNLKGFRTFVPNQDKNKIFLSNSLKDYTSLDSIYKFTYDKIIEKAKSIDVIWFNSEEFPERLFEIEHTTDFYNSFLKMLNLKYFYVDFTIVADEKRRKEYEKKIAEPIFKELREREGDKKIKFISYDILSNWHSKSFEYFNLNKELRL